MLVTVSLVVSHPVTDVELEVFDADTTIPQDQLKNSFEPMKKVQPKVNLPVIPLNRGSSHSHSTIVDPYIVLKDGGLQGEKLEYLTE